MESSRSWECIVLLFNVSVESRRVEPSLVRIHGSGLELLPEQQHVGPTSWERQGMFRRGSRDPQTCGCLATGHRHFVLDPPKMDTMFVCSGLGVTTHPLQTAVGC